MLVIGLTGGSGAGKSTVARMLADYGGNACLMSEKAALITAEKIRKGII